MRIDIEVEKKVETPIWNMMVDNINSAVYVPVWWDILENTRLQADKQARQQAREDFHAS